MNIVSLLPSATEIICALGLSDNLVGVGSAYFSRPGPRLVDSLELLAHLLHPTAVPPPEGGEPFVQLHSDLLAVFPDAS